MNKPMILAALLCMTGAVRAQTVTIPKPVPFGEDSDVSPAVRSECQLDTKLPDFIAQAAQQSNIQVRFAPSVSSHDPGRVLVLEFSNVINAGNAFLGHEKSTAVKGSLYDHGKLVGNFRARRNSMGGMFAGFKGNCSVLGRTVETLGKDIAGWLADPQMQSHLGD